MSEIHVCWEWPLQSRPADLWPLISNTDRFNADSGVPSIEQLEQSEFRRRLRLSRLGVSVEWEEEPFEWQRPEKFGVVRRYRSGPLVEMRVLAELLEQPSRLRYQVWAAARNAVGGLLVRLQLLESRYRFQKTVRAYDAMASRRAPASNFRPPVRLAEGGANRIERVRRALLSEGVDEALLSRMCRLVAEGADEDVYRIRPYAMADEWGAGRREVLEMFLRATNAGMFEMQWELLCPLCRGAKRRAGELGDVDPHVHCEACNIDFQVEFDRSVELTLRPSSEIRAVNIAEYCVGGPQNTPHIVLQQILEPHGRRTVTLPLEPGMYRFRGWGETHGRMLRAAPQFPLGKTVLDGSPGPELRSATDADLVLDNPTDERRVVVLERFAWSDQAATAADVTALQLFRGLFAGEALRPSVRLSVASLTVMFTDLQGSTRLYRELGDAIAFSRVLQHQEILTAAVEAEGGAVVKTLGDRTMAVFRQPVAALKAAMRAQNELATPLDPLRLKIGIHTGPSIAVNLNDRLDYFGATVNLAARLSSLSQGDDLVASSLVVTDPEAAPWLRSEGIAGQRMDVNVKDWEDAPPELYRLQAK